MDLLKDLSKIKTAVEHALGIGLTDEDFADGREEIEHIFLHEACHAAIAHCVPWIHALEESEHTAVDELMARYLEKEIAESGGLFVHSAKEFVRELQRYPVDITMEDYRHLSTAWEEYFWLRQDLAGMAAYILTFLRHGQVIYHILPKADWEEAESAGVYKPASLAKEGFIHCSAVHQVIPVANDYYEGKADLCVLCIASKKIIAEMRYEGPTGEKCRFPHIFGELNLDAVVAVFNLVKDEDGKFLLPMGPSALI